VKAVKQFRSEFEAVTRRDRAGRIYRWENQKEVDKIGAFVVQCCVLVRSELHRDGPIYTVLESFPLASREKGEREKEKGNAPQAQSPTPDTPHPTPDV
jgi:hypothetical protein